MVTKNVRWKCDICGDGILAPSRPRKNDVRRYCLPCSADAGVLVERTAPALEKKRAAKKVTTSKKQASKRATVSRNNAPVKEQARIDAKRKTMINKEAVAIWKLMQPYHKGKRLPTINIVRGQNRGRQYGHASPWANSIQVNVDLDQDILRSKRVWEVLAHELAHCAVPPQQRAGRGRDTHSKEFYHCLRFVWQKRWNCSISFFEVSTWGYSVDRIIENQAARHIDWLLLTRVVVKKKEKTIRVKPEARLQQLCKEHDLVYEDTGNEIIVTAKGKRTFATNGSHYDCSRYDYETEYRSSIRDMIEAIKQGFDVLADDEDCGEVNCRVCHSTMKETA